MRSTLSGWEVDLTRWLKPFLDHLAPQILFLQPISGINTYELQSR